MDQAEREHDQDERHRVDGAAEQRPADLAQRHLGRAHRRGQDRVVQLGVLQPEEDVERRVVHGAVHRGHGEQARRDEVAVRDEVPAGAGDLADQHTQAEPHGQQVEQRLEDTGREYQPGVPVDPGMPFDQAQAARVAARPLEPGQQAGRGQHPQRGARHRAACGRCGRRPRCRARTERPGQVDIAEAEHAAQVDAVPQRSDVGEQAEPAGQLGQREERAGEQHQRHHAEPEQVGERALGLQRHGPGRDRRGEGEAGESGGRPGEHRPGGLDGAERPHVHRDEGGVHRDPHRHEHQVPAEDVAGPQRRGLRRDVELVPLDGAEHGVARLAHGRVHRPGGQDGGGHEGQVADPAEAGRPVPVHQGAQPESHRAEVEQRAEQAGPDAGPPDPPVHRHPALVRAE